MATSPAGHPRISKRNTLCLFLNISLSSFSPSAQSRHYLFFFFNSKCHWTAYLFPLSCYSHYINHSATVIRILIKESNIMDIPLPENQSKWGVSITFIHHQSIMYICHSIRFLMKRKYLLPAPLPLTSAFYFSIGAMDDQYCFVLWKRQAAVTNETGRLSFSSGRSFFLS